MAVSRHQVIDQNFIAAVEALKGSTHEPAGPDPRLTREQAMELFESQVMSRVLDLEAREMKSRNEGFYTIGSSGHEANACVAAALRLTDPCFLHYRSGAFMIQRSRKLPGATPLFDTLMSLAACAEDPASGGRHKVWGSVPQWVPPQTSTIASHLPKAVGAAFAMDRAGPLDHDLPVPRDSIVVASFGDASLNHSTAVGALNTALWSWRQQIPLPLLFVCEDNRMGISVKTPPGWIESQYEDRDGLGFFQADGRDLAESWETARQAVEFCRTRREPTFLHLEMVRLMGHAGSDVEQTYRTTSEIESTEIRDPLIQGARWLVALGYATPEEILGLYEETRERARAATAEVVSRPRLTTAEDVMRPLAPWDAPTVADEVRRVVDNEERARVFGGRDRLPESATRHRHLAMHINWALHDLMVKYPELLLFGEDVARKGGVYHVTDKLYERFGVGRVFNTLLDEQAILGLAIGAGHLGYLPCPEIQYLAYLVHASDQLRGEACSLQFFSNEGYSNPMVVRVAGLGYQKGFGGHFHNDNGFAFLREIPGLILAAPSRGDDAAGMLRTCFAAAKACGRVSVFLEPIALYMAKDLHEVGDEGWLFPYPDPDQAVELGEPRFYDMGSRRDLTIVTYGNGVWMALRVAKRLEAEGVGCRVMDLRWLMPLNEGAILAEATACENLLVVDEGRQTAGIGEQIVSTIALGCGDVPRMKRIAARDSYIPLAAAADLVLVSEEDIEKAARELLGGRRIS